MRLIIVIFFSVFLFSVNAQKKDDPVAFDNAFIVSPNYSLQIPLADLAQSFGINHNMGIELSYKFKANWQIGIEGNLIFGNDVKDRSILDDILTSSGFIIGADGFLEQVNLTQRGKMFSFKSGKTFFFKPEKPNSGLLIKLGIGYIDHQTFINVNQDNVPQLSTELKRGYDRFSSGLALTQYIGLVKLQKNNFLNIAFGIELTEGFTKNRRPFDFSTGQVLDQSRLDMLLSLKFNWILPIWNGQSSDSEFYYY